MGQLKLRGFFLEPKLSDWCYKRDYQIVGTQSVDVEPFRDRKSNCMMKEVIQFIYYSDY